MANIDEIVETLSGLTVIEMAKLKSALEDKWGVKAAAAAPVMVAAAASAEGKQEAAESTEFSVTLEEAPADKRIAIIKVIREITGLGLGEAKAFSEGCPKVLKEKSNKTEAEEIVKKIQAAGGKASKKGL